MLLEMELDERNMSLSRYHPGQPLAIHGQRGSLLHNFRRYVTHIDRGVSEFDAELSLRNRGLKLVYLLDFQEIYSYLAPYLLHPEERRPFLNLHLQARELLSAPEEKIYFPLGTLAEISAYMQRVRRRIESLHKVTLSTNLDRALDEFLAFFHQEQFLDRKKARDWLVNPSSQGVDSRLFSLQKQALDLLSDFEVGASMLQKLLTHPSVEEVQVAIRQHPMDIKTTHYRDFLYELQAIRSKRKGQNLSESDFSSKVDAANTSMALALNERFSADYQDSPWMFFKIITDTNSLFRLKTKFEKQLIYRDYHGFDFNLFITARDVLFKRLLDRAATLEGSDFLSELTNSAGTVRNALRDLEFLAADFGVTPEQLLEKVINPSTSEISAPIARQLQRLLDGVRGVQIPQSRLQNRLLETEFRDELCDTQGTPDAVERPYSARGVTALQGLLQSVEQIIHNLDDINVSFNPVQRAFRKGVWNPLLTMEALGLEKETIREDSNGGRTETLDLRRRKLREMVLQVTRRNEVCSFSWPTKLGLREQVSTLKSLMSQPEQLLGILIYYDGQEAKFSSWGELEARIDARDCSFLRLDSQRLSYVTEIFSADPDYELLSGLILPLPIRHADVLLMAQYFSDLSAAFLPKLLLTDTLNQFFGITGR